MARVKRAVNAKKKRRTLQQRTKGYYGTSSRTPSRHDGAVTSFSAVSVSRSPQQEA